MSKKIDFNLITIILGTRPEAIKLAPVILAFKNSKVVKVRLVITGQHKEMVNQVLEIFKIKPDRNLEIMTHNQTLTSITSKVLNKLKDEFNKFPPKIVIVQGDTSTAFAAGLAAFYSKIPVAHVEAGLRTNKLLDPFPEEVNRRLISQFSTLHFAPTKVSYKNLLKSGVMGNISITGNTVIDALLKTAQKNKSFDIPRLNWGEYKIILATVHRRENWGDKIISIAKGIKKILDHDNKIALILPLHRNTIVRKPLVEILSDHPRAFLTEPLDYEKLVFTVKSCKLVLTDSGGLQEEAPALGKPVLVLRDSTERQEAIQAGTARLVGTESESIFENCKSLLYNKDTYEKMSKSINPFGDGNASDRIVKACEKFLDQCN